MEITKDKFGYRVTGAGDKDGLYTGYEEGTTAMDDMADEAPRTLGAWCVKKVGEADWHRVTGATTEEEAIGMFAGK